MEKGYFSASVTHGASAARAGSAPHRDQHSHSLTSPVNKKQWLSYRSWNTAWSENSVVKCCMNITNFYCHRLAFYQASLEEVTLACQLMPFGVALCFGLRGKARGGFSVSSKEISGASEQQNPGDDLLQRIALCPGPGYSIWQLHTEQPQRRESTHQDFQEVQFWNTCTLPRKV